MGDSKRIAELNVPVKKARASRPLLQAPEVWTHIKGHTIECCARTRTIIIDRIVFSFSRTDYRLAERILQSAERNELFVPFEDLEQCFDHPQDDLRRSLYRHLSKIRQNFFSIGLDIINFREQGYALIAGMPEAETDHGFDHHH